MNISHQWLRPDFGPEDAIILVLGDSTPLATSLRECCERASSSRDRSEWKKLLTKPVKTTLAIAQKVLKSLKLTLEQQYQLFKRVRIEIVAWRFLERD
jgi:hypothetical protein